MKPIQWFQLAFAIVTITVVTALMLQTNDPTSMKVGKIGFVAGLQLLLFVLPFVSKPARKFGMQKGIKS